MTEGSAAARGEGLPSAEIEPGCPPAARRRARALFVGGTDTGVGKTFVACALARGLTTRGYSVGVMKPCETGLGGASDAGGAMSGEGCVAGAGGLGGGRAESGAGRFSAGLPAGSDAARLAAASGCTAPPSQVLPYAFELPAAPAVAAAQAGKTIERNVLDRAFAQLNANHDLLLVEGAGGLTVPLAPTLCFLDLAVHWRLPLLLVASTGLGTLNHSVLSERAARAAGLRVLGTVLNSPAGSPSPSDRANLSALPGLLNSPVLAELAYGGRAPGEGQRGEPTRVADDAAQGVGAHGEPFPDGQVCVALADAVLGRL